MNLVSVQDKLIFPYLDLPIEYYDLGLQYRDETDDQVCPQLASHFNAKHNVYSE